MSPTLPSPTPTPTPAPTPTPSPSPTPTPSHADADRHADPDAQPHTDAHAHADARPHADPDADRDPDRRRRAACPTARRPRSRASSRSGSERSSPGDPASSRTRPGASPSTSTRRWPIPSRRGTLVRATGSLDDRYAQRTLRVANGDLARDRFDRAPRRRSPCRRASVGEAARRAAASASTGPWSRHRPCTPTASGSSSTTGPARSARSSAPRPSATSTRGPATVVSIVGAARPARLDGHRRSPATALSVTNPGSSCSPPRRRQRPRPRRRRPRRARRRPARPRRRARAARPRRPPAARPVRDADAVARAPRRARRDAELDAGADRPADLVGPRPSRRLAGHASRPSSPPRPDASGPPALFALGDATRAGSSSGSRRAHRVRPAGPGSLVTGTLAEPVRPARDPHGRRRHRPGGRRHGTAARPSMLAAATISARRPRAAWRASPGRSSTHRPRRAAGSRPGSSTTPGIGPGSSSRPPAASLAVRPGGRPPLPADRASSASGLAQGRPRRLPAVAARPRRRRPSGRAVAVADPQRRRQPVEPRTARDGDDRPRARAPGPAVSVVGVVTIPATLLDATAPADRDPGRAAAAIEVLLPDRHGRPRPGSTGPRHRRGRPGL